MALPKKQLKEKLQEWGVTEDNLQKAVDYILDGNSASLDALREQMEGYKTKAEQADALMQERDKYRGDFEALQEKSGDAAKVQAEFDAYKQQVEGEKASAAKSAAVKGALKNAGVQREEFLDLLMGKVDLDKVEMDGETIKDVEEAVVKPLRDSYASCFGSVKDAGTDKLDPPDGSGQKKKDPFVEGFDM